MRSILIPVLTLFAIAILGTPSRAETAAPPLLIGLILPLSGGLAQTGNDIREGALFAVESLVEDRTNALGLADLATPYSVTSSLDEL